MKMLKGLLLWVIIGFVSISTLNAESVDRDNRYKRVNPNRIKMRELYNKLDLTFAQQEQMNEHREAILKYRKKRKNNRKAMMNNRLSILIKFISKDGFNTNGYIKNRMKQVEKRVQNRATMMEKRISILTSIQRVQLVKLIKEQIAQRK
ncbi:MAG: Spy/CpxP family protein refolding chaperone [Sulfurovum sp.]